MANILLFVLYHEVIIAILQSILNVARFKKIVLSSRIGTFKTQIIEERGFRGGSDEKMKMWLGREIVVAGLPHLANGTPFDKQFLKVVFKFKLWFFTVSYYMKPIFIKISLHCQYFCITKMYLFGKFSLSLSLFSAYNNLL